MSQFASFLDCLPPNLQDSEQSLALNEAISYLLNNKTYPALSLSHTPLAIDIENVNFFNNLAYEYPAESMLDSIADYFRIAGYEYCKPLNTTNLTTYQQKHNFCKNAKYLERTFGTPASIVKALECLGYTHIIVHENYNSGSNLFDGTFDFDGSKLCASNNSAVEFYVEARRSKQNIFSDAVAQKVINQYKPIKTHCVFFRLYEITGSTYTDYPITEK